MKFLFSKKEKRISAAVLISVFGIILTEFYFEKNKISDEGEIKKPIIAHALEASSEHQRKGETSELWQNLKTGDNIYLGDTLRTHPEKSLSIELLLDKKIFSIEPGSIIQITDRAGKIKFDALDGRLFQKKLDAPMTGERSIASEKNQFSTEQEISFKNWKNIKGAQLQILEPKNDSVFYINPEQSERVRIRWAPVSSDGNVELWMSYDSTNLKLMKKNDPESSSLETKIGDVYWKLKLKNRLGEIKEETPLFKNKIEALYPPTPISPLDKSTVRLKYKNDQLKLKWYKNDYFKSTRVEIYEDLKQKKLIFHDLQNTTEDVVLPVMPEGIYYWRLIGLGQDGRKDIASQLYSFTISSKKKVQHQMPWAPNISTTQNYLTDLPVLQLGWQSPPDSGVKNYKVQIKALDEKEKDPEIELVPQNSLLKRFNKPGRYLAQVEAFDEDDEIIGTTGQKIFILEPAPLLPAIQLTMTTGRKMTASAEGQLAVHWEKIERSLASRIKLFNPQGQQILYEDTHESEKIFSDLLPGTYRLEIVAVDQFGREGEMNLAWQIVVPSPTHMFAPKLKKVEVE